MIPVNLNLVCLYINQIESTSKQAVISVTSYALMILACHAYSLRCDDSTSKLIKHDNLQLLKFRIEI